MADDLITPQQITEIAAALEINRETRKVLQDDTGKFIQATLVAANGGACVSLLSAVEKIRFDYRPYVAFVAGIIVSLVRHAILHSIASTHLKITAALEEEIDGLPEAKIERLERIALIAESYDPLNRFARQLGILRLLPIATFIIGCVAAGVSIERSRDAVSTVANEARCVALQGDMLRARPRRADSRDLFTALGCKPIGEGSVYASR